ncbi:unnamed protein product [Aureobasidium vineae]|uniref:PinX1-related protein 1 n=1 Tax=Aureobasidium vineae TaxID=2773715 RepID=A0A9N8J9J8_9PEZI|nr:unnamed protein product [Aureobasidium vineae]
MGLAGPKRRSKIGNDPNNNNWAKATDSFGHKILASQGWKPGDTLGAIDANHASHYTVGSNSHIRVLLKDDNLGLGAARGGNNAETFGLSLYSGLLGRLNGKSEAEVEKQQTAQRDVELALYQGRKYGNINFISAGFLVGDKMDLKSTVMPNSKSAPFKNTNDASSASDSSDSDDDEEVDEAPKAKKVKESKESKKDKKDKKPKKSSSKDTSSESTDEFKSKERRKKDKKRKATDASDSEDETRAERKARRAERRAKKEAKKEEKRRKREEKKAAKSSTATPSTTPELLQSLHQWLRYMADKTSASDTLRRSVSPSWTRKP